MSTEEDTELRDLVAQTLEVNGCLSKIRAELRASIFLALDEGDELQKKQPLLNKKIKATLEQQEGRTMFCLVREFLEFFSLDFTVSVYEPESYLGTSYQYEGRSKVIEDLGIPQLRENSTLPLLLQLMQIARVNSAQRTNNIDINLTKLQNEESSEVSDYSQDKQSSIERNRSSEGSIELNGVTKENLNATFDLSVPTINLLKEEASTKDSPLLDLNESGQSSDKSTQCSEKSETEFSPPVLNKSHSKFDASFDKLKLSPQKAEKLKAKSSLSSLADLPPLQLNKSRNDTLLLPSLYSKEFKERTSNQNLREIDKLFDVDVDSLDNYEEDFMSESEINLNRSHSDELQPASFDSRKTSLSGKSVESKRSPNSNSNQNLEKSKTESDVSPRSATSRNSSVISDDLNSNVDDILNSPTSN